MAKHERKTQQYDLRPSQQRLHLSVDQPKQQTVWERGQRGKKKTHHEGHLERKVYCMDMAGFSHGYMALLNKLTKFNNTVRFNFIFLAIDR